jgi:hypothetical protein
MPTPDPTAEPTGLVVEEDIVVSTMMIFPVPLSKRCTGARTIGEIFSSIEVRDANIPDIVMVVLCETLPAKDFCSYNTTLYLR